MKLKNDFSVFGSASLRKALSEELVNLSLGDNGACTASDNNILLKVYDNGSFTNNLDKVFITEKVFYLPQDWDKALAAAQDYEEVWPKYGKFISPELKHLTENKIYKLTREINIGMSDHCYEFINDLGEGDAAHITHFEIVHEEGYLKQEAEPKVGDWVVVVDDSNDFDKGNWSGKKKGDIFLVGYVAGSSHSWIGHWVGEEDTDKGNGISINQVRKATEEEIKKAQEIKDGDFIVVDEELCKKSIYKHAFSFGEGLKSVYKAKIKKNYWNAGITCDWVELRAYILPVDCVRKATPEEIKNHEEIKVSGYQAEVMNGKIAFGCQHLSKQTLQELNRVACYVDITIGDTKITKGLLTKLINKL